MKRTLSKHGTFFLTSSKSQTNPDAKVLEDFAGLWSQLNTSRIWAVTRISHLLHACWGVSKREDFGFHQQTPTKMIYFILQSTVKVWKAAALWSQGKGCLCKQTVNSSTSCAQFSEQSQRKSVSVKREQTRQEMTSNFFMAVFKTFKSPALNFS